MAEIGFGITKGKETIMSLVRVSEEELLVLLALLGYYFHPTADAVTPAQCRSQKIEPPDEFAERALFRRPPQHDWGSGRDEHATATGAEAAEGYRDWAGEFLAAAAASSSSAA